MHNKVSVVVTVKDDDRGVERLRKDLAKQTRKPDEIIIIRAEDFGNCSRAEGRNRGVERAKYPIIAVTDVGCRPHRDWLEKLTKPFASKRRSVQGLSLSELGVAGCYHVVAKTSFQQAITPYLTPFLSPDDHYFPASRSVAFTKRAWGLVGGYPEEAKSAGEDLEFARRLTKAQIRIVYAPDALVDWEPPKTIKEYFSSIFDHTKGNFEACIWPHIVRNLTVPLRWMIFVFIPTLIPLYLLWPIMKHRYYLATKGRSSRGPIFYGLILWLPVVQLATDGAILLALCAVIMNRWDLKKK